MKQYDYYKATFRAGKTVLPPKKNWFPTLHAALESEGLVNCWPLGVNIQYLETVGFKDAKTMQYISVYRDERGMYERPIHYSTV